MRKVSAVALVAAISMPAVAFGENPPGPKVAPKKICKVMTRPASHLVDRICMTAEKWEEQRARHSLGGKISTPKSGDKVLGPTMK